MDVQGLEFQRKDVRIAACSHLPGDLYQAFRDRSYSSGYGDSAFRRPGTEAFRRLADAVGQCREDGSERVSFSALGKKLALLYDLCLSAEGQETRQAALDGLERIRAAAASPSNRIGFQRLMAGADACARLSPRDVRRYLAVLGRLDELRVGARDWLKVLSSIDDDKLLQAFIEESQDIVMGGKGDHDAQELFDVFVYVWKTRQIAAAHGKFHDKRKYFRKKLDLPGRFEWLKTGRGADIMIRDLCPMGIGFIPMGPRRLDKDELIRVSFPLDGMITRYIHKLAVIRRFDGLVAGAEFC